MRTYYYDTNPLDSTGTFSQYAAGRLTAVQYANVLQNPNIGSTPLPIQLNDMYSYTQAGLPSAKRLQVNQLVSWQDSHGTGHQATGTRNFDSTYGYNTEGKATAMTYPTTTTGYVLGVPNNVTGASYNYSYDTMYRLSGMTDSGSNTIVSNVSYDAANRLLTMNYPGANETRSYNVLGQLTNIHAGSSENVTYNYPTNGTNNGKVSSISYSGETVTYTYDTLNRMITANGSGWGEIYGYDGFGNLLSKSQTGGAPTLSQAVNAGNNQIVGQTYDANGNAYVANATYDVENRIYALVGGPPYTVYSYDAQGKRIFLSSGAVDSYNNPTSYSVVAYSPSGQKLGTYSIYTCNNSPSGQLQFTICSSLSNSDKYFGGRRLAVMDQLGSAGTYYPWGEAKGSTNPQDAWSYATYWRDSVTGLDYANQRYYSNTYGRFMTPDPYQASGGPSDPQSWNRYAYTRGDPVNRRDPLGLADCETCDDGVDGYCPAAVESCAPLGGTGGGGDPNDAWYRQVDREVSTLDSLVGSGLITDWDFVNGNFNQIRFGSNGFVFVVPFFAVQPLLEQGYKALHSGYWAYAWCFLTGIMGEEISNPEVPGVSAWAMLQGLVTGAAWGPGITVVGGVTITVDLFNKEDKVARDCAKATGYTPWILQN